MVEIRWTDEAVKWLKDIYNYIALENPKAAKKVIDGIYGRTQTLMLLPYQGYSYVNTYNLDIRIILFGHYRIAYLVKNPSTIDILGVFHGAIDIDKYIY